MYCTNISYYLLSFIIINRDNAHLIVTKMDATFAASGFNGDLNTWDTGRVTSMNALFARSSFNGNIGSWNTINVLDM